RTTQGDATLAPGAILLGNHGHCFECGHEHAAGDRCVSFLFEPDFFETMLSAIPGARSDRFPIPRLPPLMALAPIIASAEWALAEDDADALEEIAFGIGGKVVSVLAGHPQSASAPSPRDQRRIATVLRRIESEAHLPLNLADLAREACM